MNGGGPAPDGNALCDMPCKGNSAETCGGPNRLDVYQYTSSGTSGSAKRGLAYNNNNPGGNADYANLFVGYSKISWGYDWGYPSYSLDSSFELYVKSIIGLMKLEHKADKMSTLQCTNAMGPTEWT